MDSLAHVLSQWEVESMKAHQKEKKGEKKKNN